MKIAFVFGTMGRGGAERVISSLANLFIQRGDDVSIVTMDASKSGYELDQRIKHIALNVASDSKNVLQAVNRNINTIAVLRKHIKAQNYDVIVSFQLRSAIIMQIAVPFNRKFKIIASERANPNYVKYGKVETILRRFFIPRVDGFIFQTERVSYLYPETLRKKGIVIPNGVFEDNLPTELPSFDERNIKRIVAVGRLSNQKRYDIAIKAFAKFNISHPDYIFDIYGTGSNRQQLEKLISEQNLDGTVILHGNIPNVVDEIKDAFIFLMTSEFEGMPNALMEAMSCGIPCVCTDCEFGPRELISDGENGLLVEVGDIDQISGALSKLADNYEFAKKISASALQIRQTLNGNDIAERYYKYIKTIADKK